MNLTITNKYLFDTTVFIDRLRHREAAKQIIEQVKVNSISAGYSLITEAELWYGIVGLRSLEEHQILLKPFKRYYLNSQIARHAGNMRRRIEDAGVAKQNLPSFGDCLIAATAAFHDLTVVTRNTRDFEEFKQFSVKVETYTV